MEIRGLIHLSVATWLRGAMVVGITRATVLSRRTMTMDASRSESSGSMSSDLGEIRGHGCSMGSTCDSQSDLDKSERPEKPEESVSMDRISSKVALNMACNLPCYDARCGQQLQTQKHGQRPTTNVKNCGQIRRYSQKQKLVLCWTTFLFG